jgi:hypothetical protein
MTGDVGAGEARREGNAIHGKSKMPSEKGTIREI